MAGKMLWSRWMARRVTDKPVWYCAGLSFECQQCGGCCGGFPGYVWVSPEEAQALADALGIRLDTFEEEYTVKVGKRRSLCEKDKYDCIFLSRDGKATGCDVYPLRPVQCRTWPFWHSNLRSPEEWADRQTRCPGINRGRHYTFEEIEALRLASPC
jgi:Fe-S-cluster containining protein